MKANKKNKLADDNHGYVKIVGGLVAFLLMIIVGVLVYWETQGSIDSFDALTETFTADSAGNTFTRWTGTTGSNYTGERVELDNSPKTITSVYVWNGTGNAAELCTVTTHYTNTHKYIDIVANGRSSFNQVNVTYTSNMASSEDGTSSMATTVFDLLPIIALAVVASIIIGVIVGFGAGNKRL